MTEDKAKKENKHFVNEQSKDTHLSFILCVVGPRQALHLLFLAHTTYAWTHGHTTFSFTFIIIQKEKHARSLSLSLFPLFDFRTQSIISQ